MTANGCVPVTVAATRAGSAAGELEPARIAGGIAPTTFGAGRPSGGLSYEVTLEGRYADVLATVRALSHARLPAAVGIASLTRKNPSALDATLVAALHVNLGWSSASERAHEIAAPR